MDKNRFIDLHLHLDGSLSISTVRELAKLQNIPLTLNNGELSKKLTVDKNCQNLNDYLKKFDFPLTLLQTKEGINLAVYNLLKELNESGLIYAEIRFAPQLHTQKGLTQDEVIKAAIDGLNRSSFKAGLILCCMRSDKNHSANIETVTLAQKYLGKGVCAIDLAGAEALYKTDNFADIFALARDNNIPFTIHAGEADGAESIYKALEFGASRIGHGVRSVEDAELITILADRQIPLELCPTSNLNTAIYDNIRFYPLRELMSSGVKVTINTDNMTVSGTDIHREFKILKDTFSLTDEEIKTLLHNAADAAFTDEKTKLWLKDKINKAFY